MAYSEKELALYEKLFSLKTPFDVQAGLNDGSLVCAPAASGSLYERSPSRLMYVGRDLGGWGKVSGETPAEIAKDVLTDGRKAAGDFIDGTDSDYIFHNHSKFWHLCRALMDLAGEGENWNQRVLWSNVYKLTPQEAPVRTLPFFWDNDVIAEYFSLCMDILKAEIDFFRPEHIVFVTGTSHFRPVDLGDSYVPIFLLDNDPHKNAFDVTGKGYYTDSTGRKVKVVSTTRIELRAGTTEENAAKIWEAFNTLQH